MTRWLPWLAELMPELFVEISPEFAKEKTIANGDYVRVISERVYRFGLEIEDSKGACRIHGQPEWNFGQEMLAVGSATSARAGTRC